MQSVYSPNFLEEFIHPIEYAKRPGAVVFWVTLVMVYFILILFAPVLAILIAGLGLFFLFALRPDWGIYSIAGTSLFHGWEISFSEFESVRSVPFLANLNAPLVEFVAFILIGSLLLSLLLNTTSISRQKVSSIRSGMMLYVLFLLVGLISAKIGRGGTGFSATLYAWARSPLFVWVAFVLLPLAIVSNKNGLKKVLKILYAIGIIAAIYGIVSLFVVDPGMHGWRFAVPFAIGGFAPMGINHNMLAEVLVITAPIGIWLLLTEKSSDPLVSWWYGITSSMIIAVALLTVSRAAWLAILVQASIVFMIYRERIIKTLRNLRADVQLLGVVFFIITAGYMGLFLRSNIVDSSNSARVEMSVIALEYIRNNPWFGYGPGSYLPILEEVAAFRLDFGEPLDAHGFMQKIGFEYGLIGLMFFGLFLLWLLYRLWKLRTADPLYLTLLMSLAGIICFQLFNTSYLNSVMWFPIGLGVTAIALHPHSAVLKTPRIKL